MIDLQPPPDLDGPIAAPDHHRVVFENDHVRVLETTIRAGDVTPLHTHLAPHLTIVVGGSQFARRNAAGAILFDHRAADALFVMPRYLWSDGTPAHTLENTGTDDIELLSIELKPQRGDGQHGGA